MAHPLKPALVAVLADGARGRAVDDVVGIEHARLRDRVRLLADELADRGLAPGSSVEVSMPAGVSQTLALLAAWRAGLRVVFASPRAGERGAELVRGEGVRAALVAAPHGGVDVVTVPVATPVPVPDGTAYVTFTSGTTGRPQAIAHTGDTLRQVAGWLADETGMGPGSRVAQWAAPGYDASLVETVAGLLAGATLVPAPDLVRTDPARLARWLDEHRVTHLQTVPTFAAELADAASSSGSGHDLEWLVLAGEELRYETVTRLRRAFPRAAVLNLYGSTETVLATYHHVGEGGSGPVPVGRAIPGRVVAVRRPDGSLADPGEEGEICVDTRHVSPGAGTPTDTGVPRYHSGDRGVLDDAGRLVFRGRSDSVQKINGTRVDLAEMAGWLRSRPGVRAAEVRPVPGRVGRRLHADVWVAPDPEVPQDERSWRRALLARFGTRYGPVDVTLTSTITRNQGGKPTRSADQSFDERKAG